MKPTDYAAICGFVHKHSGIVLGESKAYLVESRLAPVMQQFGLHDLEALARKLPIASAELRTAVVDAMTTNESFFFRDNTPFELFEKTILPKLSAARRGAGRIRIWCAAASTGQEPYSLAMILLAKKALWAGLRIEIIGTDLSVTALDRAREGRYTQFEVQRGLPVQMLVEHFTQEGTNWVISPEIRRMVDFRVLNLLGPMQSVGQVDVVFCRNVLIYFDMQTKEQVLASVHDLLQPDGYLVMGAAETMMGISDKFERAEGERSLYRPVSAQAHRLTA